MHAARFTTAGPGRLLAFALSASLILPLMPGCATGGGPGSYRHRAVKPVPPGSDRRAGAAIDGYEAFVVYFRLEKPVKAITVGISAEYVADITGKKKFKKTYFIVEKIVVIPRGEGKDARRLYPELGRNYDADWNRENDITIPSRKAEPFKALDTAHTYRIRYTAFSPDP